jgi:hypothetical protein
VPPPLPDFEPPDFEPPDFEPPDFESPDFEPPDFEPSDFEPPDFEPPVPWVPPDFAPDGPALEDEAPAEALELPGGSVLSPANAWSEPNKDRARIVPTARTTRI